MSRSVANERELVFNDASRLFQLIENGVLKAEYIYNDQGQRTRKIIHNSNSSTQTILYHYDGMGYLIAETDASGLVIRDYIWAEGMYPMAQIDRVAAVDRVSYLHTDHLMTNRLATNRNRTVVWRWEGEAFGNTAPTELAGIKVNLRFPGQYIDDETGFYYSYFRYYDPNTGRYITSDPLGIMGGLNIYLYADANPIRYIDPLGLLVMGTYDKDTGKITVTDLDTGETVTAPAFSGTPDVYTPAPNGTYTISDFPWGRAAQDNYFALLLHDARLDDYADGYPSNYDPNQTMSNIRLHSGYASDACVTVPSGDDADPWLPIQQMIQGTSQGSPVVIGGQSYPNYGTIQVIGTGFGSVP